jgi:hypothetical protein
MEGTGRSGSGWVVRELFRMSGKWDITISAWSLPPLTERAQRAQTLELGGMFSLSAIALGRYMTVAACSAYPSGVINQQLGLPVRPLILCDGFAVPKIHLSTSKVFRVFWKVRLVFGQAFMSRS